MVTVSDVLEALGEAYPWELADEGSPAGLLVGSRNAPVRKVLCSIELTGEVVEAAAATRSELLIAHHPHLLNRSHAPFDEDTPGGRITRMAITEGVNIAACYRNADVAQGGAADLMAARLDLVGARPLVQLSVGYMAKVVVFVPPEAVEEVFSAMADEGAGAGGDYAHAGFRTFGTGTFLPGEGAMPYTGEVGKLSQVEENRLEMACPSYRVKAVVDAMLEQHPYEEVAYDVLRTEADVPWGIGRIGNLAEERKLLDIMEDMAAWSASEEAALVGDPDMGATRVAVAPGPGDKLVERGWREGADLMVAGELGWNATVEACEAGMAVLTLGHLESERALVPAMVDIIRMAAESEGWQLEIEGYKDRGGRWG